MSRLRTVDTEEEFGQEAQVIPPRQETPDTVAHVLMQAGLTMLIAGMKTMSQKTLVAFSACFTMLSVGSAFWLWLTVLKEPSPDKLVGLAIYGIFVLAIEWIRRRR